MWQKYLNIRIIVQEHILGEIDEYKIYRILLWVSEGGFGFDPDIQDYFKVKYAPFQVTIWCNIFWEVLLPSLSHPYHKKIIDKSSYTIDV